MEQINKYNKDSLNIKDISCDTISESVTFI